MIWDALYIVFVSVIWFINFNVFILIRKTEYPPRGSGGGYFCRKCKYSVRSNFRFLFHIVQSESEVIRFNLRVCKTFLPANAL